MRGYPYYDFSVDEWAHWDHQAFATVDALLVQANERFASLHMKGHSDPRMDAFEIAHADAGGDSGGA